MASKRIQDDQNNSRNRPAKRSKASQACSTCRKHKTRCELLDTNCTTGPIQCHRCKVLNIECSFENSDIIILPKNSSGPPGAAPGVEFSPDIASEPTSDSAHNSVQAESPPTPPENSNRLLKVDDFIPTPRTPWGSLNLPDGFDWGVAPITAVQGFTTPQSTPQRHSSHHDSALSAILTPSQIANCLEIFESRYRPWMNLPPSKENTPALDLARCLIAARHLDSLTRSRVAPRLQVLVEKTILQPGYMSMSAEFVEVLLMFSLWEPLCGDGYDLPREGRLLATSAVEVAQKLGYDRYGVLTLRQGALDLMDANSDEIRFTRLWTTANNIEQLLLLGTGKASPTRKRMTDRDFMSVFTTEDSRDMRLGLFSRLFDLTDRGMSIHMETSADMDQFHKEATDVLNSFSWLHRLIAPLPVVSQFDSFYFHILEINYHICRLLIIHNILLNMRRVFDTSSQRMWFQVQHNNVYLAHGWTGDALCTAEAALIALLSRPDFVSLSTVPDQYFTLLTFACTFLIVARFAIYHIREGPLHGQTENLLMKTAERFQQAALSPNHMPNRCAEAIKELLGAWERRGPRVISTSKEIALRPTTQSGENHHSSGPGHNGIPASSSYPHSQSHTTVPPIPPNIPPGFATFSDPDMFFDPQFWSSFIGNLNP